MLAQCKKKDMQYKMAAIEATGSVIHALKTDVFSEFYDVIHQIIKPVSICSLMHSFYTCLTIGRTVTYYDIVILYTCSVYSALARTCTSLLIM